MSHRTNKPKKKSAQDKWKGVTSVFDASMRFKETLKRIAETSDKKKSEKRIDIVLIHPVRQTGEDAEEEREFQRKDLLRECFERKLREEQFKIKERRHGKNVYKMLHCSFERLCEEAERVNMEMHLDTERADEVLKNAAMTEMLNKNAKRLATKKKYTGTDAPTKPVTKPPWKPRKEPKAPKKEEDSKDDQCCGSLRQWLKAKEKAIFDPDPQDDEDFDSTAFIMDRYHIYKHHEDPAIFFKPAVRSLLVRHILINLDIREDLEVMEFELEDSKGPTRTCCVCLDDDDDDEEDEEDEEEKQLQKIVKTPVNLKSYKTPERPGVNQECTPKCTCGLDGVHSKFSYPYLRMKDVYTDSLILHDASKQSVVCEDMASNMNAKQKTDTLKNFSLAEDPREELGKRWCKLYKYQPLMQIRNYFGEKIAFYFAWCGLLITSLWIPMLLGLAIFLYGLYLSITGKTTTSPYYSEPTTTIAPNTTAAPEEVSSLAGKALAIIKSSFDNEVTPFFAFIICVWGTLFLELWKQKSARCAYLWDVQEFEVNEPDRPEFFSSTFREDPITKAKEMYFPSKKQNIRYLVSFSTLMFMILLVLTSVLSIIIYRVITSVDYCPNMDPTECLLATTVISSVLNTISILILGKIYDILAVKLTDWENHRTQTMYDDALIVKLFAFQFANNYASSFYIAFFRGRFDYTGILGIGSKYRDGCEGTCMSQLSFQILTNMLLKPLPKLFSDVVKPLVFRVWRNRPSFLQGKKPPLTDDLGLDERARHYPETLSFMDKEFMKPKLGDFTVGEYTEKVIQYGFLMLFAACLPLAPLIALLTLVVDIRVDAKRMLWWYRRPIATVAQDIGTWFTILQVVNVTGVVSNGFLVAFTSSWGQQYDTVTQLWIVIGFEHLCFAIKFLLAYFIPDIPDDVSLMMRKKTHKLARILEDDQEREKEQFKETLLQNIMKSEREFQRRQSLVPPTDDLRESESENELGKDVTRPSLKESVSKVQSGADQRPPERLDQNGYAPVKVREEQAFRGGPDPLTPPRSVEKVAKHAIDDRGKHAAGDRDKHAAEERSEEEDDTHVRKMKKKKKKKDKRRKQYRDDQLIIDCDEFELEDQGTRSKRRVAPLTPPPNYDKGFQADQKLPGEHDPEDIIAMMKARGAIRY